MGKIYQGDIGCEIVLDTDETLAGATTTKIAYKKPSGETGEWTATIVDATKVFYVTKTGDLDESGMWTFQAVVTGLSGWSGRGESISHRIYAAFE